MTRDEGPATAVGAWGAPWTAGGALGTLAQGPLTLLLLWCLTWRPAPAASRVLCRLRAGPVHSWAPGAHLVGHF